MKKIAKLFVFTSLPDIMRMGGNRRSTLVIGTTVLLLGFLASTSQALVDPTIAAFSNSQGSFSIHANNLVRVVEAEIRINYQSDDSASPTVSALFQNSGTTTMTTPVNSSGSLVILVKSKKPLIGNVPLAIAQISGSITFLTASLRLENGMVVTPRVSVTNPTPDQLAEMKAKQSKSKQDDESKPTEKAGANDSDAANQAEGAYRSVARQQRYVSPPAAGRIAIPGRSRDSMVSAKTRSGGSLETEERPRSLSFSRRKSLLERFNASAEEHTAATLAKLLRSVETNYIQEPPLLLSDGTSKLRFTVQGIESGDQAPQFFISGGHCKNLRITGNGDWILEIVPEKGALTPSVVVLSGLDAIEYPLAVAPPMELFDPEADDNDAAEFVKAANMLVATDKAPVGFKKITE